MIPGHKPVTFVDAARLWSIGKKVVCLHFGRHDFGFFSHFEVGRDMAATGKWYVEIDRIRNKKENKIPPPKPTALQLTTR